MNPRWQQDGVIVAGGHRSGRDLNQLHDPRGIYVDENRTLYVADWGNNRIMKWNRDATSGQLIIGGKDQLKHPTTVFFHNKSHIICDCWNRRVVQWPPRNGTNVEILIPNIDCSRLTIDDQGFLYISDWQNHVVKRYAVGDTKGTVVAGGNQKGDRLNQLNGPTYVFVDGDYSVYVSDYHNHRIMKWMKDAKEGITVAGDGSKGTSVEKLSEPRGVVVDSSGAVYVADHNNHRVMRWCSGMKEGTVVAGGNGQGSGRNQLNCPNGLALDQERNLYVVDKNNHRVQRFDLEQNFDVRYRHQERWEC